MNTIFHLKKALFYSTILLSLIILLEGCKKKSTVEDFGTRIDQCYEDRIDTTLMEQCSLKQPEQPLSILLLM